MPQTEERLSILEETVMKLAYIQINTHVEIQKLTLEMKDFKDEMKDFKDEMDETEKDRKEMNRKWGDLAQKMGTIAEDMVAPNIEHIAEKYFKLLKGKRFIRIKAYHSKDKSEKEFDVIIVYDDKLILNETKSTAKMDYAMDFVNLIKNREFYEYFPEYKGREIIPIFASLYIPQNIIKYLSKNNIYALGMGKDTIDLLNFDMIKNPVKN